jgi:hypothetical protein
MSNPLNLGIMVELKKKLEQVLLGKDYEMRISGKLITIYYEGFMSVFCLKRILEECDKRDYLVFIWPRDKYSFELSLSPKTEE